MPAQYSLPFLPFLPLLLSLLLFTSPVPIAHAHSFLLSPPGDFKSFNKPECRIGGPPHAPYDNCPGPCIDQSSFQYNGSHKPTVYRRGQIVSMVWAKNNHRGGFVRFSLVPNDLRMSAAAHNELAFRYACFDSDLHKCTDDNCGTDQQSMAYRTMVEIPTSYPDGDYTLGWAWYGGFVGNESLFGDYYGCSSVVIRGGVQTDSYQPRFSPGENLPTHPSCPSSTNRLGICRREPCLGFYKADMVPAQFNNTRTPLPIDAFWFGSSPAATLEPEPSAEPLVSTVLPPVAQDTRQLMVRRLVLVHAPTGQNIAASDSDFGTVKLPTRRHPISFVVLVQGDVQAVRFYLNGIWVRNDSQPPYAVWGTTGNRTAPLYNAWPAPIFNREFEIMMLAVGSDGSRNAKVFTIRLKRVCSVSYP